MQIRNRMVGAIIAVMVLSLAGLVTVQALLLDNARQLREQTFRRSVMMALTSAVQKLEMGETVSTGLFGADRGPHADFWRSNDRDTGPRPQSHRVAVITTNDSRRRLAGTRADSYSYTVRSGNDTDAFSQTFNGPLPFEVDNGNLRYRVPTRQRVTVQVYDPTQGTDSTLVDDVKLPGVYQVNLGARRSDTAVMIVRIKTDSASAMLQVMNDLHRGVVPQPLQVQPKESLVVQVLDKLMLAEMEPIEKRLRPDVVDSALNAAFRESGLHLSYAFGIAREGEDTLRLAQPAAYRDELAHSDFRARLFPRDMFASSNDLVVYFPTGRSYIWQQITPLVIATAVLMLIITLGFAYTIRTLLRQRRFAANTVEFINNMTHEFKTPISTIALATDALLMTDVHADAPKVIRYGQMIHDENRRMRSQVDKILQLAVLEEGDYELSLEPIDLHQVVRQAVASIALHVENRGGGIACRLNADEHIIKADPVHLTNVVHNLLDNANKYSPEEPAITVTTHNDRGGIVLRIQDNGVGIRGEDLPHVFDKYFRVPSGNVHNVKGFGIGLSYVKMMVAALHGRIRLLSQFGKGTEVELWFPILPGEERP